LRVTGNRVIYHGKASVDTSNNIITLTNDPYIITATHFVRAGKIIWYRNDGKVELIDNSRIRSFETDDVAAGQKAVYYQNPKGTIATIEGKVDSNQKAFIYSLPNIVEADMIRIIDEDTYEATGNVQYYNVTDENKATANYFNYSKKTNILTLKGNAYALYNGIKSYADKIIAKPDNNNIFMEGAARVISNNNVAKGETIDLYDEKELRRAIITKNATLEQYAKNDPNRKNNPARRATSDKIIFEESKLKNDRKLYLIGRSTVTDYSNPDSPLKGDPYRIVKADNIDYIENDLGTNIYLKGNASFEQINYRVKSKQGTNTVIEKYTELNTKSNNITVSYTPDMKKEIITLDENPVIITPTRTIFAKSGKIVDRKYALMTGNVEIYEHDEGLTEIKSKAFASILEGFDINDNSISKYILTGDVRVYQGEDSAFGNKMEISNKDKTVIIDGKAKYLGKDTRAEANNIKSTEHEDGKRSFNLTGNAKIKRNNDFASGDKIDLDERNNVGIIDGNGYYTDGNREVFSDYIKTEDVTDNETYKTTKLTLNSRLNRVRMEEPTRTIACDYAVVFQKKIKNANEDTSISAYLSGYVQIVDKEQKTTINGDTVDYVELNKSYKTASVSGDASVEQKDGSMFADIITYREETKAEQRTTNINGVGNVRVKDEFNTIKSNSAEMIRITPLKDNRNSDTIIFKGGVIIDRRGEENELYATSNDFTIIRTPIDGTSLVKEKWTLVGNVAIEQPNPLVTTLYTKKGDKKPQRNANAGVVEYIIDYPTKNANDKEETYNFYENAYLSEIIDELYEIKTQKQESTIEKQAKKLADLILEDGLNTVEPFTKDKRDNQIAPREVPIKMFGGKISSTSKTTDSKTGTDNSKTNTGKTKTDDNSKTNIDSNKTIDDKSTTDNSKTNIDSNKTIDDKSTTDNSKTNTDKNKTTDSKSVIENIFSKFYTKDEANGVYRLTKKLTKEEELYIIDALKLYQSKRQATGDIISYNVKRTNTTETTTITTKSNTINKTKNHSTYKDQRFDVLGETIKMIVVNYLTTNKDNDYYFYVNEGLKDAPAVEGFVPPVNETKPDDKDNTGKTNVGDNKDNTNNDKNNTGKTNIENDTNKNDVDNNDTTEKENENENIEITNDDNAEKDSSNQEENKPIEDKVEEIIDKVLSTNIENGQVTQFTKTGYRRAIAKDYEERVITIGDEIYGEYLVNDKNEESVVMKVWTDIIFYSEEDEFTANSDESLYFYRESIKIGSETVYKDIIELVKNAKFRSKKEVTGTAVQAVVYRDTSPVKKIEEAYLNYKLVYETDTLTGKEKISYKINEETGAKEPVIEQLTFPPLTLPNDKARLRNYKVGEIVTLRGQYIYLDGVNNYLKATGDYKYLNNLAIGDKSNYIEYINGIKKYIEDSGGAVMTNIKTETTETNEDILMSAVRIDYYDKTSKAFSRGDVVTIIGYNLFISDYLNYDGKKGKQGEITLKGNVNYILDGGVSGKADEIVFDIDTQEIISENGDTDMNSGGGKE